VGAGDVLGRERSDGPLVRSLLQKIAWVFGNDGVAIPQRAMANWGWRRRAPSGPGIGWRNVFKIRQIAQPWVEIDIREGGASAGDRKGESAREERATVYGRA